jgi:hypothetical protein
MSTPQSNPSFSDVLLPLGAGAEDFFLAASLYHAHKVSFSSAAALAGLGLEEFHYRLKEHFGKGFALDDETVLEDIEAVQDLTGAGR